MVKPPSLLRPTGYALLLVMVPLLFASCILHDDEIAMVKGNYAYSRGEYQDATIRYLEAIDHQRDTRAWAFYNLGNVYYSLGELESALSRWDQAAAANPGRELSFSIQFNRGIAAYNQGRFDEAFALFREALILQPSSVDAKINLELAQRKVAVVDRPAGSTDGPAESPSATPPPTAVLDRARLLDFVHTREGQRWVGASPAPASAEVNDW